MIFRRLSTLMEVIRPVIILSPCILVCLRSTTPQVAAQHSEGFERVFIGGAGQTRRHRCSTSIGRSFSKSFIFAFQSSGISTAIGHTDGVFTHFREGGWYHDFPSLEDLTRAIEESIPCGLVRHELFVLYTWQRAAFSGIPRADHFISRRHDFHGSRKGSVGAQHGMRGLYVIVLIALSEVVRGGMDV